MKRYILSAIQKNDDIVFLTLKPKRPSDRLQFQPGQYATISFRSRIGRRTPMRCFSITSTPYNPDELSFAAKVTGKFTGALANLQVGTSFFVEGPFGEFVIDPSYDRNVVLIAGGIGITPFMSMIRAAAYRKSMAPITLLYSYRTGHNIPFQQELQSLEAQNPRFRVITFVTDKTTAPESPKMLSGKMTDDHIGQITSGKFTGSTYFLCGPRGFMDSTRQMLEAHGTIEDRIVTESFAQSSKILTTGGHSIQKLTYGFAGALLMFGIGAISILDLARYVPRYNQVVQAQAVQNKSASIAPNNPNNPSTQNSSSNSEDNSSSASTDDTSNSTTNSNSSTTTTPTQTQTYQSPVTSVS